MRYSRANPSPRYAELQRLYRVMHEEGERFLGEPPEKTFPGSSLPAQAERIKRLVKKTGALTVLDYGSGKGKQYEPHTIRDASGATWPDVIEYWGVEEVVCYDPGYAPFNELPVGTFDGVICTDVLEHCPEEDVPWIIDEIFSYAKWFVFSNIACFPARKRLPTGENAHCTIRPQEWWEAQLKDAAARHSGVVWEVWIQTRVDGSQGMQYSENRIGNAA